MPNVSISSENFHRLQKLAVPLVDDLDSVIKRVLDAYESGHLPAPTPVEDPDDLTVVNYKPDEPPDLTFTVPQTIMVAGKPFQNRYWNPLLFHVVGLAAEKMGKDKMLAVLEGKWSDHPLNGFKHVPAVDIYVQGREANLCWRAINKLVKAAGIQILVEFEWQEHPKAALPGRSGVLVVDPA